MFRVYLTGTLMLRLLVLFSLAVPLSCIVLSALLSPWFNIFDNALSDLGHAVKSRTAPIFNFGLVAGGLLAFATALKSPKVGLAYNAALAYSGVALIFVGVFDEVYGLLHFEVSVLFFIGLASFLIVAAIREKTLVRIASLALLILPITSWCVHFIYDVPRGVAIPELVSILSFTPIYLWKYLDGKGKPS